MQVILLDNVRGVGKKGDICTVADGLATNKLLPEKKVLVATPENLAKYRKSQESQKHSADQTQHTYQDIVDLLKGEQITVSKKSDAKGNLFEKIHASDVASVVKLLLPEKLHSAVTEQLFDVPAIKHIGEHTVLFTPTKTNLVITVVAK